MSKIRLLSWIHPSLPKTGRKQSHGNKEKRTEKIWEVTEIDTFSAVCPRQKEIERGDVFYKWSWFPDGVGVT